MHKPQVERKKGRGGARQGAGKKPIVLTEAQITIVDLCAQAYCTDVEIAAKLKLPLRTFADIKQRDSRVSEAIETGQSRGRASLRAAQFQKAMEGNPTMQIWLGKQLLGQRDYQSIEVGGIPNGDPITTKVIVEYVNSAHPTAELT